MYLRDSISTVPFSKTHGAGLSLPQPTAVCPGGRVKFTFVKGPESDLDACKLGCAEHMRINSTEYLRNAQQQGSLCTCAEYSSGSRACKASVAEENDPGVVPLAQFREVL